MAQVEQPWRDLARRGMACHLPELLLKLFANDDSVTLEEDRIGELKMIPKRGKRVNNGVRMRLHPSHPIPSHHVVRNFLSRLAASHWPH